MHCALCLQDPLLIEPVLGSLRVAVEPQPGAADAAAGHRLFHKTPGHEGYLVQQHPRKGHALDQSSAAFVPSTHQAESVFPAAPFQNQKILAALLPALKA